MGKIYLLYGEEKYDIEQNIAKIKKEFSNLEVGINLFYISEDNVKELENISESVSFFGDEKLIIIKNLNLKFDVDYIISKKDDTNTYLIVEDSVDKRLASYKSLAKNATIIECNHMDEKQVPSYIMQVLSKYNIKIDRETAEYMYEVCGEDKTNLINEMRKIVAFLEDREKIVTKEIIDKVCSKTLNAKIFDMLDKVIARDYKKSIALLDDLILQKEAIVKIYIMIYKQIKQMYLIKLLQAKNEKDIIGVLKIHPFVYKKLSTSCNNYSLKDLKRILKMFDEYDEKTKIGEMDFEVGLKKIICAM